MYERKYTIAFEDRGHYLYVRLMGEDCFAASLSYWNEIADKVKTLGIRKLLVHEDMIGEVDNHEMFDLITDLLPSGLKDVQIALFDEHVTDHEINAIGQTLANSMGGKVELFESLDTAQKWLAEDV